MQWAAVSTQQEEMRTPPHMWRNAKNASLGLTWTDTCQGWAPSKALLPPKILLVRKGWDIPHWLNWTEPGTGGTTVGGRVAAGTEDHKKLASVVCVCICVCVLVHAT